MGYLMDFFTGGNVKVASNSLANLHYEFNQTYIDTYCTRISSLMHMAIFGNNAKGAIIYDMAMKNMIRNYVHLVVLDLNVFAAPKLTPFEETFAAFNIQIAHYLRKKNIPAQYISGDNRSVTQEVASDLERYW